MQTVKHAPYRADHVGSLLRPESVKAARQSHLVDESSSATELEAVENDAIQDAVRAQQAAGLRAVTDGEYRRSFFPVIRSRLSFPDDHPMLDHYRFLLNSVNEVNKEQGSELQAKISIPGPSCCHFRTAVDDIHVPEYEDLDVLFSDLAQTYKDAVNAFYAAGCRYLQMDDIFFAYLCDPKHREGKVKEGFDPDDLVQRYAKAMHTAITDRPDDMLIAMHLCRGNFRSTHAAEGAYDNIADTVFNQTGVDLFFMEYDTERAGSLEPLQFMARGKQRVMPGFITTKSGELESVDELQRKIEKAAKFIDIDQLGIAPQCGFASTEEGNTLSYDDQQRKLELVVKTAEAVWGGVDG